MTMREDIPGPAGGYPGLYKGFVRDVNDPERMGRVRVYCPGVMGDEDREDLWLDWASPVFPLGRGSAGVGGTCLVPDLGASVWVAFEEGSQDFPVYLGTWVRGETSEDTTIPAAARGEVDGTEGVARTTGGVTVPASRTGEGTYPYNRMVRTARGAVLEVDDTTGKERIRVRHPSGSWVEWEADGALWKQVLGDFLLYVGARLRVGAVQEVVLAGASVLLGSTTASQRVVREDRLTAKFNGHTHTVSVVQGVGSPTVLPTTAPVSGTLDPADFSAKVKFDP